MEYKISGYKVSKYEGTRMNKWTQADIDAIEGVISAQVDDIWQNLYCDFKLKTALKKKILEFVMIGYKVGYEHGEKSR